MRTLLSHFAFFLIDHCQSQLLDFKFIIVSALVNEWNENEEFKVLSKSYQKISLCVKWELAIPMIEDNSNEDYLHRIKLKKGLYDRFNRIKLSFFRSSQKFFVLLLMRETNWEDRIYCLNNDKKYRNFNFSPSLPFGTVLVASKRELFNIFNLWVKVQICHCAYNALKS